MRKIVHIDMDAFFASVEQRDNPALRGKPVAVAHDVPRGVVSTASYEARPWGVHSALSIVVAKQRCPQLVVVPPDFAKYKAVSAQVHEIFREYTDLIEPVSLDEAFLDVTENKRHLTLGVDVAKAIKADIKAQTQLTASAGVSYCKFIAKIASDYRKPDGLCVVHPQRAAAFLAIQKVERFWGVGPKTAERMHALGIHTGADLRRQPLEVLLAHFGKVGSVFYNYARGIDDSPVVTDWERKSVSCERTFEHNLTEHSAIIIELYHVTLDLLQRLAKSGFAGYTLTLKIKFGDFTQITRSVTANERFNTKGSLLSAAKQLLAKADVHKPIRLMGLGVSNAEDRPVAEQDDLRLF